MWRDVMCLQLVHQEELLASLSFVYAHPTLLLHILAFCVCATVGQLFIFYTVKVFGAVLFAAIMSVRILFSTLLSCWVYGHAITELGGLGILLVFGAVAFRIRSKLRGRPLLAFILTERDRQRTRSHSSSDQDQVTYSYSCTYTFRYLHTYIHLDLDAKRKSSYIHTFIHTYIHTYIRILRS